MDFGYVDFGVFLMVGRGIWLGWVASGAHDDHFWKVSLCKEAVIPMGKLALGMVRGTPCDEICLPVDACE